jgi:hypothetical protein
MDGSTKSRFFRLATFFVPPVILSPALGRE